MKKNIILGAAIGLALGTTGAQAVTFNFGNSTATSTQGNGFTYTTCTGVSQGAAKEFRMCNTTGTALGGGLPAKKDTINGTEQWMFSGSTTGLMTGTAGTATTGGVVNAVAVSYIDAGYIPASIDRNGGAGIDQGAIFFSAAFGFVAPTVGSDAVTAGQSHVNDIATNAGVYTLAANGTDFTVFFDVLEAQWNGVHFDLGRDGGTGVDAGGTGITFTGTLTNVNVGAQTADFHMWAEHTILGSEDNTGAGFGGWTAQWVYDGTLSGYHAAAVPVPAAAWLFGSGLLGLVGVARRKKASA